MSEFNFQIDALQPNDTMKSPVGDFIVLREIVGQAEQRQRYGARWEVYLTAPAPGSRVGTGTIISTPWGSVIVVDEPAASVAEKLKRANRSTSYAVYRQLFEEGYFHVGGRRRR